MFNTKLKSSINEIITKASLFGLPQKDVDIAYEYINYNEHGLAIKHIADQLFEFDIKIDEPFYHSIISIADKMTMEKIQLDFLKNLVEE
ncbi:hypothetical protein CKK33_03755 [Mucilaginibacter sp. MD40]|uniref:MafI family immunity protein n=1 Tax=Mucilaginibacter sp. MD40 TaxID=2029590 RepID=UPI000BACB0A9|nr:MafI family immunity protein [Mucilaginibacter sp. MD40]PAW92655.1 hypothetical protein CKK33_03755 [Mucilaginibacter sp. MD40]